MDELTAKQLQAQLEKEISDWSLQRLLLDKRLKYMKTRMLIIGSLIFTLEMIRMFIPQLVFPPYNSIVTLALSVWFVVLVVKYSIGYKDKRCTRSAERIIQLAADYNEAVKDVPNARHCDFLPPEVFEQKKSFFVRKRARAIVVETANQAASTTAAVTATATGQAAALPLVPSVEI